LIEYNVKGGSRGLDLDVLVFS